MFSASSDVYLRRSLLANALFTVLCGLALVSASGRLAAWIGGVEPATLLVIGGVLLPYAADLTRTAFAGYIPRGRIYYFITMDVLWVMGTVVLLVGFPPPFTTVGTWVVLGVADIVGLFAILQYLGLRKSRAVRRDGEATVYREDAA